MGACISSSEPSDPGSPAQDHARRTEVLQGLVTELRAELCRQRTEYETSVEKVQSLLGECKTGTSGLGRAPAASSSLGTGPGQSALAWKESSGGRAHEQPAPRKLPFWEKFPRDRAGNGGMGVLLVWESLGSQGPGMQPG